MLIGGTSKVIASTVTYPYQLVKSKLQQRDEIDPVSKETRRRYTGTLDCVKKVWRWELDRVLLAMFLCSSNCFLLIPSSIIINLFII